LETIEEFEAQEAVEGETPMPKRRKKQAKTSTKDLGNITSEQLKYLNQI
jgi:hypothetical protein